MLRSLIIITLLVLVQIICSPVVSAQDQINIMFLPINIKPNSELDTLFIKSFPEKLRDSYNHSSETKYSAITINDLNKSNIRKVIQDSDKLGSPVDNNTLSVLYGLLKNEYSSNFIDPFYFIQILAWKDKEKKKYYAEVSAFDAKTLKTDFSFEIDATEKTKKAGSNDLIYYDTELTNKIIERLVIECSKNIRIALAGFKMYGGKSTLASFEKAIPSMIESRLLTSSQITLLESRNYEEIIKMIDSRDSTSMYTDQRSLTDAGKLLSANYLIMGDYLEYDGTLQLNVRCINFQTSEIIAAESISSDEITIKNVNKILDEITNKLIIAIKADYVNQPRKTIAIVGLPPKENIQENRYILTELIETISKKLKYGSSFVVLEDPELLEKYIRTPHSKWIMSSEFGSDYLLIVKLEKKINKNVDIELGESRENNQNAPKNRKTNKAQFILDLEFNLFEPQNPNKYEQTYCFSPICESDSVDDVLE